MVPPELRFKNSRSRLDRAYVHLRAFDSEWHAMMEDKCASTEARKDKSPGWHIIRMLPTAECIERFQSNHLSLVVGEIAYQLRAALDGLMWDAITYTQGAEPPADASNIDFPILNGKVRDFNKCGFHKYPFPQDLADWLRTIQPDTADKPEGDPECGLQNVLEDIHNLARFDRHRRLRVVGVLPSHTRVEVARSTPPGGWIVAEEWLDYDLFGGKNDFARIKVECAGGLVPYDVSVKTNMTIEISVEGISRYGGGGAGVQLHRFIQAVEYVVGRFDKEFA